MQISGKGEFIKISFETEPISQTDIKEVEQYLTITCKKLERDLKVWFSAQNWGRLRRIK